MAITRAPPPPPTADKCAVTRRRRGVLAVDVRVDVSKNVSCPPLDSNAFYYLFFFVLSSLIRSVVALAVNTIVPTTINMRSTKWYWPGVKLFAKNFHSSGNRLKAKVIDGKSIANTILKELRVETEEWISQGHRAPRLVAVLVGQDPASNIYVSNKMKAAKVVGIETETIKFNALTSENELLACIQRLNHDENVDGILVQLPLPEHITERTMCNAVAPHKDVDGFNIVNIGRFCLDMQCLGPCTPLGVHELIRRTGIPTFGKNAVVCGRSKNVGMPIAMLLHADNAGETSAMDATTTICHRYTPPDQLAVFTKSADIIVSAAGVPNLIRADMVKPGAVIIDVGITRVVDRQTSKSYLVGDVDFERVSEVAGYITPVPGGVGPMTVAMLMRNTIAAAKKSVIYNILDPGAIIYKQASQIKP